MTRNSLRIITAALLIVIGANACTRSASGPQPWRSAPQRTQTAAAVQGPISGVTPAPGFPARDPNAPVLSPTPDPPRVLPTPRLEEDQYLVQRGDSLGMIARRYGISLEKLIEANSIINPDLLEVGQVLTIPAPDPLPPGPNFKIIPDSELVYSPSNAGFDLAGFISQYNGYLNQYKENVDDRLYTGAEVVGRVAYENSVNPRLLLAVLEHRSGWVTRSNPSEESRDFPLRYFDNNRRGLYRQLSWAANNLDRGYYLWKVNALPSLVLMDDGVVPMSPTINAGTAGVQYFYSLLYGLADWENVVGESGLHATYRSLFGFPFDYSFDPLVPPDLTQPTFQLPFEPGDVWSFTGGPHGGWADGSAWAALDFAPPGPAMGCVLKDAWVVAIADGVIVRSDNGAVVQDLDGDGLEQTGWTVLYMHIDSWERVQTGTFVRAGERIGHASCEGGYSTGTHLHLARRYNGEWISADGQIPFVMDGWVSQGEGSGIEYNGYLVKDGALVEAWAGRGDENQISR